MPFLVDRALCQRDHRTTLMALWGALGSVLCAPQALGVQWESQADRLQNSRVPRFSPSRCGKPPRAGSNARLVSLQKASA
jgi:hypothetical protein